MTVIEQIKADMLVARKAKDKANAALYALVLSEIDGIGKNDGNRATTNDEAIVVIKKMVTRNNGMIDHLSGDMLKRVMDENLMLSKYLPAMINMTEVEQFVDDLIVGGNANIGAVMGAIKKKYGQSVDMKAAGKYVRSVI